MMTIGGSWGVTLLVGAGMLLILGLTFLFLTRSLGTPSASMRCPMTGHMTVVQHIADESGYLTDMVTCSAFPHAQPVACGLPCLTGGVPTRTMQPRILAVPPRPRRQSSGSVISSRQRP